MGFPMGSLAQVEEDLTIPELELAYRAALAGYGEAFQALEVQESRFNRASNELQLARAEGDQSGINEAFSATQEIAPLLRQQEQRVGEKAEEVRVARERLLAARNRELEELLQQRENATTPEALRELAALVADARNRISELRAQEDLQVTLEPEPDITIRRGDGPEDILLKVNILEVRQTQYEEQLVDIQRKMEELREEQSLLRRSGDFLAGVLRYDDPSLPVGPPGAGAVSPPDPTQTVAALDSLGTRDRPLTLEERIQLLQILQEEVTERIEQIQVKAENFRRSIRLDLVDLRGATRGVRAT
jgi:hypothetical protein